MAKKKIEVETPEAPEMETPETPQAEENVSLALCNLTSRGYTLAEARAILAETSHGGKGEAPTETLTGLNLIGLPIGCPDSEEGLAEALKSRGFEQHPNTKLERLISVYRKEVLGQD